MSHLKRALTAPFRLLYWLNYGNDGTYRSKKRSARHTRPLTHAELNRTTQEIENKSGSGPRYDRGMWH